MAASAIISDGTTDIELVYNSASQDDYKLRYGMKTGGSEPSTLWHRPDNAPPQLIRLTNENQVAFLTLVAFGDDRDDLLNNLITIKRWVDGSDQQAARYHIDGDVDEIYLRLQLDSATNYTDWSIIYGNVDDSEAHASAASDFNTLANNVVIMLVLAPLGTGAAITLRNDLASSPHMIEDSNGDGLADGWGEIGTPSSTSINTTAWLIGGSSQFMAVNATATNEGIETDAVTASTSTTAVGYAWVRADNDANDPIIIRLADGSFNIIDTETFDPGNPTDYDKTAVGANGRTWYRYSVSGTNTTAANFILRVFRTSAAGTTAGGYFIDGAYLQTGTTTAPDAWCSTSAIENRYDPTHANQSRINYVDVWGVPGDADALVQQKWTTSADSSSENMIVSKVIDGKYQASDYRFYIESEDFSSPSGWTETGTGVSGTTYKSTNVPNTNEPIEAISIQAELESWILRPPRVFIMAYATDSATTFQVNCKVGPLDFTTDAKSPETTSAWRLVDLGTVNPTGLSQWTAAGTAGTVNVILDGSAGTARFDGVWLFPTEEILFTGLQAVGISGINPAIDGLHKQLFLLDGINYYEAQPRGSMWTVANGNKMTRYIYFMAGTAGTPSTETFNLSTTMTLSDFNIYPRTRHLLGTL